MGRFLQSGGAIFAPDLGDLAEMRRRYTVSGTPGVVNTPLGKGMAFNGTTDYLTCPALPYNDLDFTTESFTLSAWVFPTYFDSTAHYIFYKGVHNVNGYLLYLSNSATSTTTLRFQTNQAAANQQTISTSVMTMYEWQHIAATRSGAAARVYRNGADVTNTAPAHTNPLTSSDSFIIGSHAGASFYKGQIVCPIIFPRALSATEVLNLAQGKFF